MSVVAMLAERLATLPVVERVVLFGSRARGDGEPRSDVDLAIAAPSATASEWRDLLDVLESAPTLLEIDAVRLEEAPDALRDRIAAEGRVLFERQR